MTRLLRLIVAVSLAAAGGLVPARALAVCAPDAHPGGEWTRMGYDLGQSRHQPAERTIGRLEAARLTPVWTFSANEAAAGDPETSFFNEITGYPIVADGCVYVGSSTGTDRPGWFFALNADGGEVVWKRKMSHGIYGTAAVADGIVYTFVSRIGSPYVAAMDARTGELLWTTTVDVQPGSDAVSSPIVYDGMVWVGVSGTAAEGDESTRFDFRGTSVVLEAGRGCANAAPFVEPETGAVYETDCRAGGAGTAGRVLAHTFAIPFEDWEHGEGDAGGAIWSTISIDPASGFGYVGTGNPFNYEEEHEHTNALIKIDMRRSSPTLGEIVAHYKGTVEEYFPELADNTSCDEEDFVGFFMAGFECGRLDLDFGAAPQVFRDRLGRLRVGEGQKSGVYHVVDPSVIDPETGQMKRVWTQIVGFPSLVGGIVGTPAYDGTAIYTPHTIAGYIAALDRHNGDHRWVSPVADGVHWGSPVTSANGVLYTVDLKGFLDAYDAQSGAPLLHRPMGLGANTGASPTFSWGGVTVARNTVYASVGVGLTSAGEMFPSMPNGFVIAYRPARLT